MYCAGPHHHYENTRELGVPVPPFCVRFHPTNTRTVALADEEGAVVLLDYDARGGACGVDAGRGGRGQNARGGIAHGGGGSSPRVSGALHCHNNAIFDLAWSPHTHHVITASGDQTCRLTDVSSRELVLICRGHTGSVKALSARPLDPNVFASCGRDGCVCIFDVRRGGEPVMGLSGIHSVEAGSRKRRRAAPTHGVSAVQYLDEHTLATGGASDGTVKIWDGRLAGARKAKSGLKLNSPLHTLTPGESTSESGERTGPSRAYGVIQLAVDPAGRKLLVSSSDHQIHLYDRVRPSFGEVAAFWGHSAGSFYLKAAFSPDGRFIVSGSTDAKAYMWEVERSGAPVACLRGHLGEVTGVDWSPHDFFDLVTCSDDCTVKRWSVVRGAGDWDQESGTHGSIEKEAEAAAEGGQVDACEDTDPIPLPPSMLSPVTPLATTRRPRAASESRQASVHEYFSRI